MIAMTGWKRPLAAACLALCASMGDAFAPLPLAPSRRPRADGLRAASSAAEPAVSRRSAMARALTLVGGGATLGAMPRASVAKATKATAADTVAAWNTLMDVMDTLNGEATELTKVCSEQAVSASAVVVARGIALTAVMLPQAKDWDGLTELLSTKDFAEMEDNLLKLVNGPVLNTDDKKSIGTRKRYGIAADVSVCLCVRACVRAARRACVRVCMCASVRASERACGRAWVCRLA